jgi:outer membrane protein assembly factor BamD
MSKLALAATLLALILCSCGPKKTLSADQYFAAASEDFRTGALTPAVEQYRELLDQHPFSEYSEEAELRIAQAQYLDEDYAAAIVSLTDFQRRHPTSPHLPLVGYYLGMCYAQQMGTVDRDQTAAQNAHTYFATLAGQYPDSPFAQLSRQQLSRCRESMAGHEMYIANYYSRIDNQKAAEVRLLLLAAQYGDTPAGADALLELTRIYAEADNSEYATLAYRALEALHPEQPQTERAREQIDLAKADLPPTSDPLDLLLIANGRRRPTQAFNVPPVSPPPVKPLPNRAPAMPTIDPFGRSEY